ncbi:MAG: nitroreductase family protein [Bacteroidales bacterium]|nr:nitroreductase family protein [Bacteroidales bacterium]
MIEAIKNHKSIRKYRPDAISGEVLDSVLKAGTRASTTGNMQVYSMVVTTDPVLKEKLWEAHFRQDMVKTAPVHITFCADFNRFNTWCRQRDAKPGYDNFLSFFTAAIDALLASQNVCLEAESQGLGICYLGTATYNAELISDILELPAGVVPVAAIVMGYPEGEVPLTERLPMDAVVHKEKYKNFSSEDIDRIYKEREESAQTAELLKINGLETLAQIFTDKRYTKNDNEFFSEKYLNFIRKQGFL